VKPILVVDDDLQIRIALTEAVRRLGYQAVVTENGEEALRMLRDTTFSMIVTDMRMPRMDGVTFLKEVRKRRGNIPVLVITGFGTIENAVETMKEGATDYLMKPFSFETLKKAIETILARENQGSDIVTENEEMMRILNVAGNLAASDITVLVYGESGTGKELLARSIHSMSSRRDRPFVAVNCAAIPENLLESELFGYEKGAFTGAADRKAGKFELAQGGSILLDEIGEMPMVLQAKLLRVLQEREIDRIGGRQPLAVDVRVIATTNRDLQVECAEGRFREDLYYRLSVFPLRIPPLRDRPEDVALLAQHFLRKCAPANGRCVTGFSEDALQFLREQHWRGNVRELQNVVQRALFLCRGSLITREDLLLDAVSPNQGHQGRIRDMEKELIMKTLRDVQGNKTRAARLLGVSVRTIRNKLNEYGQAQKYQ